ncbi:hypothetical protein ACCAA_830010 [Candidatus Accumulibacter aalborgensis]|uniref:DUF1156 domain-containing protein n=1 Tax=Candidatus Accumulibacter aalborgensis TaxID=1860102 RepID=A0A1A8Y132_9PROT|nr:hypothetical protein ACCAA_830010 [Candidatus Accumulibacter aalborgensis]
MVGAAGPLAAARPVIFAQMVDDPSGHPDIFPAEKKQQKERQRLFRIIEDLVKWENATNETVLQLEAQGLGLESYASDLNPVAVLINKAMIEIPPKFAGKPPVNPVAQRQKAQMGKRWRGAQGLAEDVRYYGQWMRDEAETRIGHL